MPIETPALSPRDSRPAYPTDVSERQWRMVQPLLPQPSPTIGRPRVTDLREVLSAVCYRWRTGCTWRMLPHDFPPWGTVYAYYRDWERAGILDSLRERLHRSR